MLDEDPLQRLTDAKQKEQFVLLLIISVHAMVVQRDVLDRGVVASPSLVFRRALASSRNSPARIKTISSLWCSFVLFPCNSDELVDAFVV